MEKSKLSTKISYKERKLPVTTPFNIILANAIRQEEKKVYTDSQTVCTPQPCHRWYDHPSKNLKELTKTVLKLSDGSKVVVYKVSIHLLTYIPTMNKRIWNEKHNTIYVKISQNTILRYKFTKCKIATWIKQQNSDGQNERMK